VDQAAAGPGPWAASDHGLPDLLLEDHPLEIVHPARRGHLDHLVHPVRPDHLALPGASRPGHPDAERIQR